MSGLNKDSCNFFITGNSSKFTKHVHLTSVHGGTLIILFGFFEIHTNVIYYNIKLSTMVDELGEGSGISG